MQIRVVKLLNGPPEARRALLRMRLLAFFIAFQSTQSPTGAGLWLWLWHYCCRCRCSEAQLVASVLRGLPARRPCEYLSTFSETYTALANPVLQRFWC